MDKPDSEHVTKTAPRLTPPDRPGGEERQPRNLFNFLVVLAGLLLIGAPLTAYLLSSGPRPLPPPIPTTPEQAGSVPLQTRQTPAAEIPDSDSEAALQAFLRVQAEAQSEHITKWAEAPYREILTRIGLAAGDPAPSRHLGAPDYLAARDDLADLLNDKPAHLRNILAEARQALARNDAGEAAELFSRVLLADPGNTEAAAGKQQALVRHEVLVLFDRATAAEEADSLDEAVAALEQLLHLDPAYAPAKSALARVSELQAQARFQAEMSMMLGHLEAGRLEDAETSLAVLKQLDHGHPQVEQAARLLAEKRANARIADLRAQAEQYESAEAWDKALAVYDRILETAPEALFAVHGRKDAAGRLELDRALAEAIDRPQRLQDEAQRQAAGRLLDYARSMQSPGPRLQDQITRLQHLLQTAARRLALTIESDNQTEITIYHVGRLGRFHTRTVELTPGSYTIVGTRTGFRDSRRIVELSPEKQDHRITVFCTEPI